jgi:hypothetical protein
LDSIHLTIIVVAISVVVVVAVVVVLLLLLLLLLLLVIVVIVVVVVMVMVIIVAVIVVAIPVVAPQLACHNISGIKASGCASCMGMHCSDGKDPHEGATGNCHRKCLHHQFLPFH